MDVEGWLYWSAEGPLSIGFGGMAGEYFRPVSLHQVGSARLLLQTDRTTMPAPRRLRSWTAFFRDVDPGRTDAGPPPSGECGDNVVDPSRHTPWYQGPTLLGHLETVHIASDWNLSAFRLPVQWVNRPNQDFRGFAGTVAAGTVAPGDEIVVLPSGRGRRSCALSCGGASSRMLPAIK